jgi:hypothetical protein
MPGHRDWHYSPAASWPRPGFRIRNLTRGSELESFIMNTRPKTCHESKGTEILHLICLVQKRSIPSPILVACHCVNAAASSSTPAAAGVPQCIRVRACQCHRGGGTGAAALHALARARALNLNYMRPHASLALHAHHHLPVCYMLSVASSVAWACMLLGPPGPGPGPGGPAGDIGAAGPAGGPTPLNALGSDGCNGSMAAPLE